MFIKPSSSSAAIKFWPIESQLERKRVSWQLLLFPFTNPLLTYPPSAFIIQRPRKSLWLPMPFLALLYHALFIHRVYPSLKKRICLPGYISRLLGVHVVAAKILPMISNRTSTVLHTYYSCSPGRISSSRFNFHLNKYVVDELNWSVHSLARLESVMMVA